MNHLAWSWEVKLEYNEVYNISCRSSWKYNSLTKVIQEQTCIVESSTIPIPEDWYNMWYREECNLASLRSSCKIGLKELIDGVKNNYINGFIKGSLAMEVI